MKDQEIKNVSSTYLSHIDGFSDVDLNVISLKYSMYTLANIGDNGDPKARAHQESVQVLMNSIQPSIQFTMEKKTRQ